MNFLRLPPRRMNAVEMMSAFDRKLAHLLQNLQDSDSDPDSDEDKMSYKDPDSDSDDEAEVVITPRMKADQINRMFSRLEKRMPGVKRDRDQMLAKRPNNPFPRFKDLIGQVSRFSTVVPDGDALSRKDISDFKEQMSDFFLKKHDVGSESVSYFTLITDVFCEYSEDLLSPSNSIHKHTAELLYFALAFLQNLSDCSANFSRQIANNDHLMQTFLKMIRQFSADHMKGTLACRILQLLMSSIGVIYNIVRRSDSNNVMRVRELGFIDALKPLLESDRFGIKDLAMLILIFAASEDDAKQCCCDKPTINFLIGKLKEALKSKNHRSGGYSDVELMEAIRKLAVIDVNKKTLAKLGCLELMKKVLEDFDDEEVVSLAFAIMTQLAFDQDNAKWINKKMQKLLDSKFMKSSQPHLREAARSLMWVTEEEAEPQQRSRGQSKSAVLKRPASARPPKEKHIMVSYNHASTDFVKKLVQTLERAKLGKVWVDTNDMKENWLDDMAFAVENAWIVLACVSLKYKDSENCKSEALYARKCGVPIFPLKVEKWKPDGWLGILIVPLTYFDFSKEDANEQNFDKLVNALHEKRGRADSVDGEPSVAPESSPNKSSPPKNKTDFSKWSAKDVQSWCKRNNIPGDKCQHLDGKQLQTLKEMLQNAPPAFYDELKELKFSLKEKSAFMEALKAL